MTQVSWVRQFVLATTLLVLGGFAYWLQYKHKPAEEAQTEQSKKIIPIKGEAVEWIRLSNGKDTYEWHCLDMAAKLCKPGDNSKWEMSQPLKARADDSNLNSLVSAIANLDYVDTIDLKPETTEKRAALLKDYGLSTEQLQSASVRKIDIKTDKGETIAYFGATNPIGDNIFTALEKAPAGRKPTGKADENTVYVSPSYFKNNFEHNLAYWRDKKLFNFVAGDITGFKLVNHENSESLEASKKDGQWTLHLKDGDVAGDIESVDSFLTGLSYLAAKDFASDNHGDAKARRTLKGAKPLATVTLSRTQPGNKGSDEIVLNAYEKVLPKGQKPKIDRKAPPFAQGNPLYATVAGSDPLYELQPGAKGQLAKTVKDLRLNKLITSMDRFNARKLEFTGAPIGPTPLSLAQESGKWVIQPDKKDVDNRKFQETLDKLTGNRIKEFLTDKRIPSGEKDGITMTLGDDKNPMKYRYLFWRANGSLYARNLLSKRREAFLVDSAVSGTLPWIRGYYDKQEKKQPEKPAAKAK